MPLGTLALTRQRANLALYFGNEIVDASEVGGCFLEATLSAALTITIETDAGRFLKQLAPFVGTVAEQRVDHLRLDDYPGISAETGPTHHVVDVAQTARGAVQEIIALSRPAQSTSDDYLPEWNVERAVIVLEVE